MATDCLQLHPTQPNLRTTGPIQPSWLAHMSSDSSTQPPTARPSWLAPGQAASSQPYTGEPDPGNATRLVPGDSTRVGQKEDHILITGEGSSLELLIVLQAPLEPADDVGMYQKPASNMNMYQ